MNRKMAVATALLFPVAMAYAVDPPQVKEGLWSIHRVTITNPGNKKTETTLTLCRSHAFDQYTEGLAKNVKGCTKINESFSGGKYVSEMSCVVGGSTIVSKSTASYSGDTAWHSENHATYTPPTYGMSEMTMIQDQKYLGSCPAGMQPGDQKTEDGHVLHLWRH